MESFRKLLEDVCLDDKGTVLEYFEDFIKVSIAIKIKNEYYSESDEISFADALDKEEAGRYSFYFRDAERVKDVRELDDSH